MDSLKYNCLFCIQENIWNLMVTNFQYDVGIDIRVYNMYPYSLLSFVEREEEHL